MTTGIGDDKQLWSHAQAAPDDNYSGSFRPNYYMSSIYHTAVNSEDQPLIRISLWQRKLRISFLNHRWNEEGRRVMFSGRITKKGKN